MKKPTDLAASIRQRLLNRSRAQGDEFTYALSRYAIERLLVRLDASPYRDLFILKGAALFVLWSDESHRATWDLDFLGPVAGSVSDTERVFREVPAGPHSRPHLDRRPGEGVASQSTA